MVASSRHARRLAATTRAWNIHGAALVVSHTNSGTSTIALAMRRHAGDTPAIAPRIVMFATPALPTSHLPEPAGPALELCYRAVKIRRREVGPQRRRDP